MPKFDIQKDTLPSTHDCSLPIQNALHYIRVKAATLAIAPPFFIKSALKCFAWVLTPDE